MTTRRAVCSCGQLRLTLDGEPHRISMCHCLECQRRTGAVISNQARFRNDQVTISGKSTEWKRTAESGKCHDLSFLSDVRVHCVLGECRVSGARQRCHWQFRRPDFPGADPRGVGNVAPPVGYLASRHAAEALGQAGMTRSLSELIE
jgi:hypothetical protein